MTPEALVGIDEVIDELLARYPGYSRGATASWGNAYYEAAAGLTFRPSEWGEDEFVAEGPGGGLHFVGIYHPRRVVTCGPKGTHPE